MYKLKSDKIYFPKGTSEWVGISNPKPMMKITITSGGGMGGARWERYVEPVELDVELNEVINIETGEKFLVNSSYIVEVHYYDLYFCEYLCTNSNLGLNNDLCDFYVYTNIGAKVKLIDEYKSMEEWVYR